MEWSGVNAARVGICDLVSAEGNDDSCHALSCTNGAQRRRSIKKEKDKSMRKTLIATVLVAVAFPAFAQQQPVRNPPIPRQYTRRELS